MVQTQTIIFSLVQAVFVVGLTYVWFRIDTKRDYGNYLKLSVLLGFPLGFVFDFAGVVLFNLWEIKVSSILGYLMVVAITYVLATPLLIETQEYFIDKLDGFRLPYSIKISPNGYLIMGFVALLCGIALTSFRVDNRLEVAEIGFFIGFFSIVIVISDVLLSFVKVKGILTQVLNGNFAVPISIIISGFVSGFLWELLNKEIRLWNYENISGGELLGIPIVVIFFWGTLNLTYWTLAKLIRNTNVININ